MKIEIEVDESNLNIASCSRCHETKVCELHVGRIRFPDGGEVTQSDLPAGWYKVCIPTNDLEGERRLGGRWTYYCGPCTAMVLKAIDTFLESIKT